MLGSEQTSDLLSKRVSEVANSLRITRSWLSIGGSFVAAISAAVLGFASWPPTVVQAVFGVLVVVGAGLGSYLELRSREDPTEAIDQARRELVRAERYEALANERLALLRVYDKARKQLESLYLVFSSCRGTIEQAFTHREFKEVDLIDRCLADSRHDLQIALGFETGDYWTICVYRTERSDEQTIPFLRCITQQRSVNCHLDEARIWPLGVGVGGAALAQNREVYVPDTRAHDVGNSYELSGDMKKETDDDRYRSMVAVPVSVSEESVPWGIVIATSSSPRHFGADVVSGVPPEEAVRALAGIAALAVLVCDGKDK